MLSNTSFSQVTAFLQLAWDSVSLGALKKCARYYQLSVIQGWQPKRRSIDLEFGILMHSSRERYYHARAKGQSHNEGVDAAVEYAMQHTWNKETLRPWITDDPNKNRFTLVRSIVWYLDHWEHDPLQTIILADGKPAVELSFRHDTGWKTSAGESILLCGHLDRLATFNDRACLSDLKTTKHTIDQHYFEGFTPDNQMSLYSYASTVVYAQPLFAGIIIDALQIAVTFTRPMRGPVSRSAAQIDEWLVDTQVYVSMAEVYAKQQHWPMNDKACFRCEFRGICSKPPSVRDRWLQAEYTQRVWDPLVSRGDI